MASKIISLFKHIRTKYKRYTIVALILIVYGLYKVFGTTTQTETISFSDIYRVQTGSIQNSIKVLGTTSITDQQVLTFGQEGTIKKIYVKEGQFVKKGTLLAEIDKKNLKNNIAQQSLSIQNAKINYNKLLNQYTDADKLQAQNTVTDTEKKLEIAKKELQDMLNDKGDTLQTNGSKAQEVFISVKGIINDTKNTLDTIDEIFTITDKYEFAHSDDSSRELYIGAKNSASKTTTKTKYYETNKLLSDVSTLLNSLQSVTSTTIQNIKTLQDKTKTMLDSLSDTLDIATTSVNSSIVGGSVTQSQISNRSSTLSSANSKVLSQLSSLNNSISSLKTTSTDIENQRSTVRNLETQLQVNKENLQTVLKGAKSEDVQIQLNNLKQMQISLSQLSEQSENYELTAAFDGNIDIVNMKVGDNITMDNISEKSITISNPNIYQIDMLIDQVDIVKIQKGQFAEITFDSYPGYAVTGSISDIDPTPVTNAGVVSYTAKISMTKGDKKIYDSMTTNIKIITEQKDNVIVIPSSAIQTINNTTAVQIMQGATPSIQPIEVGITDGTNSEILSGLVVGNRILLKSYKSSSTSSSSSNTNTMRNAGSSTRGLGVGGNSRNFGGPGM